MSIDKTKQLGRTFLAVDKLHPNPLNPNEMSEAQFNLLADNIEQMGITDPILVMPHAEKEGEYTIVGGEHRWEVAKLHGYTEVPCTVITDPDFDSDQLAFQTVRHNIIGGKMSPAKFAKLFESLDGKYAEGVAAEMFGFVDEEEFQKLIKKTAKSLPKELQTQFKEAAKELKTIDDLAKLLNTLFATHGDTLPHGYMIMDFGGYESVWLRLPTKELNHFRALAKVVRDQNKAVDHVFAAVLQAYASGNEVPSLATILAECPDVKVKDDAPYATLDFLET